MHSYENDITLTNTYAIVKHCENIPVTTNNKLQSQQGNTSSKKRKSTICALESQD